MNFQKTAFIFEGFNHFLIEEIKTPANYESRVIDNWNNCKFWKDLFKNNAIIQNAAEKRIQSEVADVQIDGFVFDTSSSKRSCCCHARLKNNEVVEIIEEKNEKFVIVNNLQTCQMITIPKSDVLVPVVETFRVKKTSLVDYSVTPVFEEVINILDLA